MRSLITILFFTMLFDHGFGQPVVSDSTKYPIIVKSPSGLSLVIMTRTQANEGYNAFIKVDELTERLNNCRLMSDTCGVSLQVYKQRVDNLYKVHANDSIIIAANEAKTKLYADQLKKTEKEVKRQKFQKWLAISGAAIIGVLAIIF